MSRLSTICPGRMLISVNTVSEEFVGGPTVLGGLAAYAKVEYLPFSIDVAESSARTVHPEIQIARLSWTTKQGLVAWLLFYGAPGETRTPGLLVRSYAVSCPLVSALYCLVRDASSVRRE